ncbi:hypothetical protein L596_020576 [Steinernema carpocapsae]|uniref:Uncharacterized protein n=1 Tax=Steinernema carpocapsae TaxID=34508 RepID=A0A4U5MTY5_STECR|nr:hypothetical protein L596_020576 [Steinernema carpocapsae]
MCLKSGQKSDQNELRITPGLLSRNCLRGLTCNCAKFRVPSSRNSDSFFPHSILHDSCTSASSERKRTVVTVPCGVHGIASDQSRHIKSPAMEFVVDRQVTLKWLPAAHP